MEYQSGKIRHAVNAETRNFPASLTKLMTLYLLFEAVDNGKLTLNSKLKISRRSARQPASKLGLVPGQRISVKNAINALIIKSANDVATVVAENLGGTERSFALLMTNKARKIGMSRTTFRNASGLSHRGQKSTARDMATLALKMIKTFPQYYHLFGKRTFVYNGRRYITHNKVLRSFQGAEGMKTGYIRASGYNLITTAQRNGQRLVGVIFGGNTARSRDRQMKKLLNREFSKIAKKKRNFTKAFVEKMNPKASFNSETRNKHFQTTGKYLWGIQVGAFNSRKVAITLAKKLFREYSSLLSEGQISIMPMKKNGKHIIYRSRILRIGMTSAYKVCRLLKRNRQPCIPLRLPREIELALG